MDKEQVTKAVKALQKHVKIIAQKRQQTEILPDEVTHFYVTFTLKHLKENVSQGNFGQKPMAVQLPHSLLVAGDEVCLITKDPQQDFKDLLAKHGITSVNKVIGIKKLRDRFKTYESRRDLAQLYQVFLADDRILPLLPKLLGKQFYEKKKLPLPVRLTRKDLKAEIEKALSSTMYFETSGTCTCVKIAHSGMSNDQIVENIFNGFDQILKNVEGGWSNIQCIHLKTSESVALPLYTSLTGAVFESDDLEKVDVEALDADGSAATLSVHDRVGKAKRENPLNDDPFYRRLFKRIKLRPQVQY